ncbi:GNAT family N-acetyltransferase [Roseibium aggregatum]|uniref:GNAT family N-acetyltransferase n=1 Tax=Roseibium aggregatum TaxID=187304 RepID=UPI0025AD92D9|nr:GNAT family N-acetyltransferase [Roseibium aggregatum]WJS04614.1 GNAT family N-acetyltransferase [Roseibium aggregatum]
MIAPVPAIAVETPLSADMGEMIAELNDLLLTLSPPEACYHMTAEEMSGEATTVFVARIDGKAAACGALHRHADGIAEVKRMYTRPTYQGLGLGSRILDRIIELATREGISMLVLETGDKHPAAWRIYERAGFSRCGPVLDYPDSPYSIFYSRPLAAA